MANASLFGSIKNKLFGEDAPVETDEYGLRKPQRHKQGILSSIADYALPALVTAASGGGALPGLAAGYFGKKGSEGRAYASDTSNYNRDRAAALQSEKMDLTNEMENKRIEEAARHNKAMEGIGFRNAGARGASREDDKRALDISTRYQQGQPTTEEERAWFKSYMRLKKTKDIDPYIPLDEVN